MKKAGIIFLLAVMLPALLLGYLSLQSAGQQGVLIENQEAKLRQQQVNTLAGQVALAVRVEHETFIRTVNELTMRDSPTAVAQEFNARLKTAWSRPAIGFSVRENGDMLSPRMSVPSPVPQDSLEKFIFDNAAFLKNYVEAEVYPTVNEGLAAVQQDMNLKQSSSYLPKEKKSLAVSKDEMQQVAQVAKIEEALSSGRAPSAPAARAALDEVAMIEDEGKQQRRDADGYQLNLKRKVAPQRYRQEANTQQAIPDSALNVARSKFNELVQGQESGMITRFVDDRLEMLFWMRPQADSDLIFGARILPEDLRDVIAGVITQSGLARDEVIVAVLDERARPFESFPAIDSKVQMEWSQPFVASEVGEMLPHWEVGLYLKNPGRLTEAARISSWTISGLILISLVAILAGGAFLMADTRRQLELVRKKTDFVSNVSHELKTPLTSIRMFAELLREKRMDDEEKSERYLNIITVEAERLTRLINNVLDFSRMERHQKTYHKESLDLYELLQTVWSGQELHLQQEGFITSWHAESGPYPVWGDADAIAQILVNLISNAEKYSDSHKEIELHSYLVDNEIRISVMDRGMGVPAGEGQKIFEHFYRAHDSLATGIQGSGLGLTLAMRIATDHGGRIEYESRAEGGSRFTLHLPKESHS